MTVQSKTEPDGSITLTVLVKTLDRSNAANFREAVGRVITPDTLRVTVDCSSVDFMDSSGVGALLHAQNLLPETRRPILLANVVPRVFIALELMQVHRVFNLEPAK